MRLVDGGVNNNPEFAAGFNNGQFISAKGVPGYDLPFLWVPIDWGPIDCEQLSQAARFGTRAAGSFLMGFHFVVEVKPHAC